MTRCLFPPRFAFPPPARSCEVALGSPHHRVRAVVTWAGEGEPIVLALHGPDGEVVVRLTPKRALTLAQELIQPAVQSIKVGQWGEIWPGWSG